MGCHTGNMTLIGEGIPVNATCCCLPLLLMLETVRNCNVRVTDDFLFRMGKELEIWENQITDKIMDQAEKALDIWEAQIMDKVALNVELYMKEPVDANKSYNWIMIGAVCILAAVGILSSWFGVPALIVAIKEWDIRDQKDAEKLKDTDSHAEWSQLEYLLKKIRGEVEEIEKHTANQRRTFDKQEERIAALERNFAALISGLSAAKINRYSGQRESWDLEPGCQDVQVEIAQKAHQLGHTVQKLEAAAAELGELITGIRRSSRQQTVWTSDEEIF
ncbi:uncharacterized protein LOC129599807 [Paramacrobiotus metropolitanus]|uniref:uncharacterized protein LOC129599807 n=1 Tax=Paramacrobiotus metropolitanus TaxID=2943436 RepID=UPI00244615F9|nr:uncharacterized protein LOC129599807 [Paramacrobiotus metropolitanus]